MGVKWSKMGVDICYQWDYNFGRNYKKDFQSNCRNMLTIRIKSFTLYIENKRSRF